jgi:hypothetical protein
MGSNLLSIISKYTAAGAFLREMTEIIRKVNSKGAPQETALIGLPRANANK